MPGLTFGFDDTVATLQSNTELIDMLKQHGGVATAGSETLSEATLVNNDGAMLKTILGLDTSSINAFNQADETPLMQAAKLGQLAMVTMLVSCGADINKKAKDSSSPFVAAALEGRREVCEYLSSIGANCSVGPEDLYRAIHESDALIPLLLAQDSSNVNTFNRFKRTPVIEAASLGKTKVLQALIDKGADINKRALGESSAVMHAWTNGHLEAVDWLLTNHADVSVGSRALGYGNVLYQAVKCNAWNMVELLIKHRNIDDTDQAGYTPLMRAIVEGRRDLVVHFLDLGASPTIDTATTSSTGRDAVNTALLRRPDLVSLLNERTTGELDRSAAAN